MSEFINSFFSNKKLILLCIIFFYSAVNLPAEKIFLINNWQYSLTNENGSWHPIDIKKPLTKQKINLKKGDVIYLKLTIDSKEMKNNTIDSNDIGINFGKIEGMTYVFFNRNKTGFWYNEQSVYFKIPQNIIFPQNELILMITKTFVLIPGGELEIIPYIDNYSSINNSFILIYFIQILLSISIFFLGIYYALFYSKELKKNEFLLLFILCILASIYTFLLSPGSYDIGNMLGLNISIASVKIRLLSLYIQPFIGLLFIATIFNFNSIMIKKIKYISGLITMILVVFIFLASDVNYLISSTIIFHIFALIHFVIYMILTSKSLKKNKYESLPVLIGLIVFSIFSIIDIADNWKIINFANRFPVYSIGILFFIFLLGIYLAGQYIKANLNLIELTKTLEHKVAVRTQRIEELIKQKTDFFGNISHELRTPLTLILGPVEGIMSGKFGNSIDNKDEMFKMILYNGTKLLRLINNLLDFTKMEESKAEVKKQKLNISELLKFYVSSVKSGAETMGLNIIYNDNNTEGKLITYTDHDMLEKAVFNLISNSMKFTPKGGNIIVQLDKEENEFIISVKDTGIGIPEDKLEFIFERFNHIDNSSLRKFEGTGIGLALTKELVSALGGKISVKSILNEGTVFTINLPYYKPLDEDLEIKNIEEIKTYLIPEISITNERLSDNNTPMVFKNENKNRILIVEDNTDMQKYLMSIMENEYSVFFAENGEEGISKARSQMPDLILSDVMMPEMDGYMMTEIIKTDEKLKMIPVILLTAKADIFMKIEGFDKGADDYIVKPFNSKELCARIKVHIEIKKLRDKLIKQNEELEIALKEKIGAQDHLIKSEIRFREMAENLPFAIIEIDAGNRIEYFNKYAEELLNLSMSENLLDYLELPDKENLIKSMKSLYQKGDTEINLYSLISKTGMKIKALFKSNLIYTGNDISGIRFAILEFEPNVNIILLPDKNFYEKYNISEREKEIITMLIMGLSYKEISENIFRSYKTIDNHIRNIYMKTNVSSRHDLIKLTQDK
jgi:signal transduction histidine kinase/DNA-binding response OmpR family regulator/DNA-binding CsgD family transcriptional regulator